MNGFLKRNERISLRKSGLFNVLSVVLRGTTRSSLDATSRVCVGFSRHYGDSLGASLSPVFDQNLIKKGVCFSFLGVIENL